MLRTFSLLDAQTLRLTVTGAGAAVLFYTASFVLIRAGAPAMVATLAAYTLSFVTSYTVQHRWTFGGQHRHGSSLPRYVVAQIACAAASAIVARAAAASGLPPSLIALASTIVASALSFGLTRFWVFAGER